MGIYDCLPDGQQVKCWWNELRNVAFGDAVPAIDDYTTYSIALREGGYANVTNGIFTGVTKKPSVEHPVFDKWGDFYTEDSMGVIGEDYLFEEA